MQIALPTTQGRKTLPVVFQSQAWPSSQAVHVIRNLKFFFLKIQRFTHLSGSHTIVLCSSHSHSNLLSLLALCFEVKIIWMLLFLLRSSRLHKVCPLLHIPLLYNFKESGITVSNLKFPATVGMSIFDIQKKGRFLVFLLTFKNLPQNHSQFWYQITRLRPDQQSEYQISKAEIFWVFDLVFFRLRSILCSRTSKCPWSPIAPFNWRQHRLFSTHI